MLLLRCFRTLMSSPLRVSLKPNLRKSGSICAGTFKPVEVSYSNFNFNLLFKRNYIRYNTGSRMRRQDGLPEGFELVYHTKHRVTFIGLVCLCYFTVGLSSWYIIKSYAFKNDKDTENINIFNAFTIPKADPGITAVLVFLAGVAATTLYCTFKTPQRMYVKNDELIAVTYSFLGPYTKKQVKCSLGEIRPLAPVGLLPWLKMIYDLRDVRLIIFRRNFRFFVPNAINIGLNKPLRTKLNDIEDKVKEWFAILLRRK